MAPTCPILIQADVVPPQPWKNGGGETRELLTWPSRDEWRVRISLAEIRSDGPFSEFPGVWRWFTVVEGDGVCLTFADFEHVATTASGPISFDGASPPGCRLRNGPTRDLNLMTRNARSTMRTAVPGEPWASSYSQCGLFTAVPGTLIQAEGPDLPLPAFTLAWYEVAPSGSVCFETSEVRPDSSPVGWWMGFGP